MLLPSIRLIRLRWSELSGATTDLEVHSRWGYDLSGRVTSVTHGKTEIAAGQTWNGTSSAPSSLGASNLLSAYFIGYDKDNRVTALSSWKDAFKTTYVYDGASSGTGQNSTDQLASATSAVIPGLTLPHPLPANENYGYDSNGNRLSSGGSSQSASGTHNRLQSDGTYNYEYDNEGNQTKRTSIASGAVTEYAWDFRNRLTMVTDRVSSGGAITKTVEYIYDAFNQRVGKRVDSNGDGTLDRNEAYAWADGQEVLRFVDSDGAGTGQPYRIANRYLWGAMVDQLLSDEQYAAGTGPAINAGTNATQGLTLWALSDQLGSVRDVVDNNGVIRQHVVYDSFGRRVREVDYNASGTVIPNNDPAAVDELFGYTARDWDADVGLQNNRARWYDPATGRWLSQDPIGFGAGDANLYRYVENGTTSKRDPLGLYIVLPEKEAETLIAWLKYHKWQVRSVTSGGETYITMTQDPMLYTDLQREIVGQMLSANRRIEHDSYEGLLHEVYVRREIVNAARKSKLGFQSAEGAVFKNRKLRKEETTGWHAVINGVPPIVALRSTSGTQLGCQMATSWVVSLGIAEGTILRNHNMQYSLLEWTEDTKYPHALALESWTETIIVNQTRDLIPGDWIYFRNSNWHENAGFGPGEQGHNAIFWSGVGGSYRSILNGNWESFSYTMDVIRGWYGWNSNKPGKPVLITEVMVPHNKIFCEPNTR